MGVCTLLIALIAPTEVSATFRDDFSNNLFSDLAPYDLNFSGCKYLGVLGAGV